MKTEKNETVTLKEVLKKPDVKLRDVLEWGRFPEDLTDEDVRSIESEVKYEGYLKKQEKEISRLAKLDKLKIPEDLDYKEIPGLTRELLEKLKEQRPGTLGQAKKIRGMTPAAAMNIILYLEVRKKKREK